MSEPTQAPPSLLPSPPQSPPPPPPPPSWLPPLNAHDLYNMIMIAVDGNRLIPNSPASASNSSSSSSSSAGQNPAVKFIVHTSVFFFPDTRNPDHKPFKGLKIEKEYDFNYRDFNSVSTLAKLFQHVFTVPFRFNHTSFLEQYYNGGEEFSGNEVPITGYDDLIHRLTGFVNRVKEKPNNRERNKLVFGLTFVKKVHIPDEEHAAWRNWYGEKKRSDPLFKEAYMTAIGRPRTYAENIREMSLVSFRAATRSRIETVLEGYLNDEKEGSCTICLDEVAIGAECSRLPCKHGGFHGECITRWLSESRVCPICRFSV